jgi:hypothetical protein
MADFHNDINMLRRFYVLSKLAEGNAPLVQQ